MPRKIHPLTIALLDARMSKRSYTDALLKSKAPRPFMVEVAKACVGITEIGGQNKGPEVEAFLATVNEKPGNAWCMAFIQTLLAYTEYKFGIVSPVYASSNCMKVWEKTPASQRVKVSPLAGAIAIYNRTGDSGHTGLVLDCDGVLLNAIEGNADKPFIQLNQARKMDGDGIGYVQREYVLDKATKGLKLVGCLKPF